MSHIQISPTYKVLDNITHKNYSAWFCKCSNNAYFKASEVTHIGESHIERMASTRSESFLLHHTGEQWYDKAAPLNQGEKPQPYVCRTFKLNY